MDTEIYRLAGATVEGKRVGSVREMLLAILATPPLRTSGHRTQRRVRLAASLLGFETMRIVNLLNVPTGDVTDINLVGREGAIWAASREALSVELSNADATLLAWGVTEPSGAAREHFRQQVTWVNGVIRARNIDGWTVGDSARHPSRWQRYTYAQNPSMPFDTALRLALTRSIIGLSVD